MKITQRMLRNDPKVTALVYITAIAPDQGESVESIIKSAFLSLAWP